MTRRIPRLLARSPIPLYRIGLGFLFGHRMTMLEHIGRTSGQPRYVVVEVLDHDDSGFTVVSGYGPMAQWYRNVRHNPHVCVWTGLRRAILATAQLIPAEDVARQLEQYRNDHPRAAVALGRTLDLPDLATTAALPDDVGDRLPLVRVGFNPVMTD